MPEEYEAYKNMANGIFDNFERYVRDNKPPKESNPGAADAMGWGWQ
jgi:hypothetical protein